MACAASQMETAKARSAGRFLRRAILAMALTFGVGPAFAATITNGSFESGTTPAFTSQIRLNSGSTALTGWKVDTGNIDLMSTYWRASDVSRSVDLSGSGPGSISTTILGMIVGRMYNITFDMAANPETAPNSKVVNVSSGLDSQSFSRPRSGSTLRALNWTTMLFSTTATAMSQLLTFRSLTTGSAGAVIDNVRIALVPIPLPATAPLALLGLAGLALLRRQRTGIFIRLGLLRAGHEGLVQVGAAQHAHSKPHAARLMPVAGQGNGFLVGRDREGSRVFL